MDKPYINNLSKDCNKHNQPILFYDQNGRNPQCQVCLQEKGKLITFEQIQKQYQEKIIHNNKDNDLQLQQLQALKEGLLKYQEKITASLNKSIQLISDQIKSIQQQQQSLQQLDMVMNKYESIEDFIIFLNNNQKTFIQLRNQIITKLLLDFKQNIMKIDFLHSILNKKQQIGVYVVQPKKVQISEVVPDQKKNLYQMEYELIQQVKSSNVILDFAIDQRNNTLIAGTYNNVIKIYDFQNGKVGAELQILKTHTGYVSSLYCMKKTHSFVSGSEDSSLIIWCLDKANKWKVQQTLKGHYYSLSCIIMNSNEDLLISASIDYTVKFWRKLRESWNLSQTIDTGSAVNALSLNEKEDKLIACNSKYQIIVMKIKSNQEWNIVQIIKVNQIGDRLCFTIKDQFAFQAEKSDYLEVYDFCETQEQFYQKTKLQAKQVYNCSKFFPCQYIKKLNILTVKHGQFLNIFKVNQNGEYQLIQSIEHQGFELHGRMTDDGENLIIYNGLSKQIQVRKLKVKEGLS